MATIDESGSVVYDWDTEGIYRIETTDPVEGGVDGISNRQAQQLACRTRNLHDRLDQVEGQLSEADQDGWVSTDRIADGAVVLSKIAPELREPLRYAHFFAAVALNWGQETASVSAQSTPALFDEDNLIMVIGDQSATIHLPTLTSPQIEIESIQVSGANCDCASINYNDGLLLLTIYAADDRTVEWDSNNMPPTINISGLISVF